MRDKYIAHEETKGEFTLRIIGDDDPMNPREDCDWLGKMVCWHRRYDLGDEQPRSSPNEYLACMAGEAVNKPYDWELIPPEHIQRILDKHFIILPLYLYDHSGITMSTGPFGCPWDSGQVGFIYVSVKDARKEFKGEDWQEKAIKCLESEVETYDDYLTNNCYGYQVVDGDGNEVESCWGFLGDYNDYVLEEGRDALNRIYLANPEQKTLPFEELSYV